MQGTSSSSGKSEEKLTLKEIIFVQFIIIVLLLINIAGTYGENEPAFIEVRGIEVREFPTHSSIDVKVRNVGDEATNLNVMGEIFTDQGQKFSPLDYVYSDIKPGESKNINLGVVTINYFVIRVYITWNGGSLVYSEEVV